MSVKPVYILSADVGTSYIKVGLYDSKGNCKNLLNRKVPSQYSENGALIQYGEDFVKLLLNLLKELIEVTNIPKNNIEVISFSGQMAGIIGIDKDWNDTTIWSGTMDTRQNSIIIKGIKTKSILKLSGTNFPYMAQKIKWFEKNYKSIYSSTSKFIGLSSYIIGKIADLKAKDAFLGSTYLTWTGLADLKKKSWSEELCSMFKVDIKKLPLIIDSTAVVGKLSKFAATYCNLNAGIPIVVGAGDKISGCIGAGAVNPGMIVEECASVAAMSLCIDEYKPAIKYKMIELVPSAIPGYYYSVFFIAGSGLTMDWFVDNFAQQEKLEAISKKTKVFKILDKKAEKINPGSDNLLCIGHLGGRALPFQPEIRGSWIGYSFLHNKFHFYRSLLEGYAYEYKYCLSIMKKQYSKIPFTSVRVIGGGSNSKLWNNIKANVLTLPYEQLNRNDISLLGASIIGGTGIGIFYDIKNTATQFIKIKKTYMVSEVQSEKYLYLSNLYLKFLARNKDIFSDLNRAGRK